MDSKLQHGYLVLADISGFTSFMAATELDHAHDVIAELIELLVSRLTPLLTLSEVEGDAVFALAPQTAIPEGIVLLELLDATYVAFRDRVEGIRRHTTCTCNACRLIPSLDLKFITHCGDYYLQDVAGRTKPVGSPVNLLHRLAKNHVCEVTGWQAYALFSAEAVEQLELPREEMYHQQEGYEHLGSVETYSIDLRERYRQMAETRRSVVMPAEAHAVLAFDVPAPPAIVWDWLNDPQKRSLWQHMEISAELGGRRGVGTRNHCRHGKNAESIQTVVDWRPFDYFTYSSQDVGAAKPDMMMTHRLEPIDGGTHLTVTMKLLPPMPELAKRVLGKVITKRFHVAEQYQTLAQLAAGAQSATA
jgi:uncharacterized protein YndB with AHSA1/START domain